VRGAMDVWRLHAALLSCGCCWEACGLCSTSWQPYIMCAHLCCHCSVLDAAGATRYSLAITAMSSLSTTKLFGQGSVPVAQAIAAEAAQVNSNVCWGLLLALRKPTGVTCRNDSSAPCNTMDVFNIVRVSSGRVPLCAA
jgi:hypothetical protein